MTDQAAPQPVPGPPVGTCATCRFWEAASDTAPGRCHYHAPQHAEVVGKPTVWPITSPTDWCGQYASGQ